MKLIITALVLVFSAHVMAADAPAPVPPTPKTQAADKFDDSNDVIAKPTTEQKKSVSATVNKAKKNKKKKAESDSRP